MDIKDIISNGVDIIKVERIEKILKKENKDSFFNRVFNEEEIIYFKKRNFNPKTIAGYFAVKEGVMKSLGYGIDKLNFKDILILKDKENCPYITLNNKALEIMKEKKIKEFKVSISHEEEYAIAFVISI